LQFVSHLYDLNVWHVKKSVIITVITIVWVIFKLAATVHQ